MTGTGLGFGFRGSGFELGDPVRVSGFGSGFEFGEGT